MYATDSIWVLGTSSWLAAWRGRLHKIAMEALGSAPLSALAFKRCWPAAFAPVNSHQYPQFSVAARHDRSSCDRATWYYSCSAFCTGFTCPNSQNLDVIASSGQSVFYNAQFTADMLTDTAQADKSNQIHQTCGSPRTLKLAMVIYRGGFLFPGS